jgi:hypothetical protein
MYFMDITIIVRCMKYVKLFPNNNHPAPAKNDFTIRNQAEGIERGY